MSEGYTDAQLLDLIRQSESTDFQILVTAKENAKRNVLDDPSAANLAAYEKAKKMLAEAMADREKRKGKVFDNRLKALEYLQEQGFKIQKSKLYKDCKDGLLKIEADGTITERSVELYILNPASGLERHRQAVEAGETEESQRLSQDKAYWDIERLKWQAQKNRFDFEKDQGKYLPRDSFELEMAARAAVLRTGIKYDIEAHAADWIHLVGGRADKYTELVEAISEAFESRLHSYVSTETYQVIFTSEDAAE